MVGGRPIDLAATIEAADDAVIGFDPSSTIVLWNNAAEHLYGYAHAEAIGQTMSLIVPPEHLGDLAGQLERVLAGGSVQIHETRRRRKDGSMVHISVGSAPLRGVDRRILGVLSIHRDIGAQIRERDDLRQSTERLALTQQVAQVGSWEFDTVTGVVTWSAELYRIYGLDPSSFVPSYPNCLSRVHRADRARIRGTVQRVLETRAPATFEHQIVWPDGTVRVLEARAEVVLGADGSVTRMFGTGQDITAAKAIGDELRLQNETLELVSRATNDAVWERVLPGNTMLWHHGLEAYGYSRADLEAMTRASVSIVHPEDLAGLRASVDAALAGQESSWSRRYRLRRSDGSYATVLARGFIVRDTDARPVRFVGSLLDLTERERSLDADRRNDASAAMLGRASHELRTPLNAILGFSELLQEQLRSTISDRQSRYLQNIQAAGDQLLVLIDHVLDLSKVAAGRLTLELVPVTVAEILDPIVGPARGVAAAKGLAFDVDATGDVTLTVDPARVRQILGNLVSNALKFTPAGGRVVVRAAVRDRSLVLVVADTGVGIPAGEQERLFTPFERLHEGPRATSGSGLGLALTRQLVELHGGSITCISSEGEGSTFTVLLPEVVADTPLPDRLLVVEDLRRDAELIVALAAGAGLTAEVVGTIADARRAIARSLPRGIVLDLQLPDGRGEDLLRSLRADAATRTLPAVVVTAADDSPTTFGADDVLVKPLDHARLRAWLQRVAASDRPVEVA